MTVIRISAFVLLALGLVSGLVTSSRADIAIGQVTDGPAGAVFVKIEAPPLGNPYGSTDSVGSDNFQSDNLFGFDEMQDITLNEPLSVDKLVNGQGSFEPGTLPTGTQLASHYIFFDSKAIRTVKGFVRFDQDILAVITSEDDLADSDFLGQPDVHYINTFLRGLEASDTIELTGPREITVSLTTATPGDYFRVVTAVPEPSTLVMASLFALLLAGAGRRRRRRSSAA